MNHSGPAYWLLKSEPSAFSIDDLARSPHQTDHWDGVRNYQARNFMRDQMRVGDLAFFYHSNCKPPAIVGIVRIVRSGYPDHTAWDPDSPYFDPKSTSDHPRWYMVDVQLERKFSHPVTLPEMKVHPELAEFRLLKKGNRLSVMPVDPEHWHFILAFAEQAASSK
ncbi:MAG: EVE domain-containing protein [Methylohalobius crimeensis]